MNFGENIQDWFMGQIGPLFFVVIAAVAIYYLIKREFSRFVGFGLFALIVSAFVFMPEQIKTLGKEFFNAIFQ